MSKENSTSSRTKLQFFIKQRFPTLESVLHYVVDYVYPDEEPNDLILTILTGIMEIPPLLLTKDSTMYEDNNCYD